MGTDPELFLKCGGEFVSAYGLFPGTKSNPHPVEKGAVQVDGLALEFNIDPADNAEEFDKNISTVLAQMEEMVKEVDKDMELVFTPFAEFDAEYFKLLPFECKLLGCDPDFDCYYGLPKDAPDIMDRPFRTAAGHIHVGWTEGEDPESAAHFEDARFIAQSLEGGVGYYTRYKDPRETKRLEWYGKTAFRPKSYGVEWRSPSNLWVQHPAKRRDLFERIKLQIEKVEKASKYAL